MIGRILVALLLTCGPAYAIDSPGSARKLVPGFSATTPHTPGPVQSIPVAAVDSVLRFVAVDIQGVKIWLGGGDLDLKEYRGSKSITFKLLNKLDADHGFAIDSLKIKQVVHPGEEITLVIPLEDIDPALSVYHYYCHLHPSHLGGTGVVTGKDSSAPKILFGQKTKEQATPRPMEESPKTESEVLKGKLIKIERGFYVVESAPGKEIRVSAPLDPAADDNGKILVGEWIEAQISSDLHVTAIKKSPATYMVEGDLIKVEGDVYTVADSPGNLISVKLNKETKADGTSKVGDRIKAEFTPEGRALSIRRTLSGPASGSQAGGSPDKGMHPAQEILKLDREWVSALLRRDPVVLDRVLADDATVMTWKNDVLTKAQYLGDITSGDLTFKAIDIEGAKARMYGDAALVTGRYAVKGRYKEQDILGQHRYTNLYVKQQGAWRLVSHDLRLQQLTPP